MSLNSRTSLVSYCLLALIISLANCDIGISVNSDGTQQKLKPEESTKELRPIRNSIHSQYNVMWVTPIEIFNLSTIEDGILSNDINIELSSYALSMYSTFLHSLYVKRTITLSGNGFSNDNVNGGTTSSLISNNDKFFHFQKYLYQEKKLHKKNSPLNYLQYFKENLSKLVAQYLTKCGLPLELIKKYSESVLAEDELFLWMSVHSNGSYHAPHSHESSIVSGVFYTQIPTVAEFGDEYNERVGGEFVLNDARGSGVYPFGMRFIHTPVVGQLILFPGYIVHYVQPVFSSDVERISFSFNIPGSWDDISDTSMFYTYPTPKKSKKQKGK